MIEKPTGTIQRKCDNFFALMEQLGLALSFDDVRTKTCHSNVVPANVNVASKFSRNIAVRTPLASAAMDTVTESRMAIEMAKAGGIGVVHKKLDPKRQEDKVQRVKFFLNGKIDKPICVHFEETMLSIMEKKDKKNYPFNSFPVLDAEGRVVGILTKDNFAACVDYSCTAGQRMSKDILTAPPETNLDQAYEMMSVSVDKKHLMLVDADRKIAGMYSISDIKRIKTGNSPNMNLDKNGHLRVAAAIGTGEESFARAELLIRAGVDALVIDTAHGDSDLVFEILRALKSKYPDTDVVAGNVSEGDSAKSLVDAGADGVKVGQGPGSICTTRIVAGVGCPQVTAVYNCAKAIRGSGVPICADGGIKWSGDITIAIGAGADCVMLGRLLAGAPEAPGDEIEYKGQRYKVYRGMGSLSSMRESAESRQRYRQGQVLCIEKLVPEGVDGAVPCDKPVEVLLSQFVGGLMSGMGYVGAATIDELHEKADFYRISAAGLAESHPHDIVITAEAPNYKK